MALISLSNIFFGYGDNNLLDGVSYVFNDYDKIAIIGDNGCGKTTLLKMLAGDLLPDSGNINKTANTFMLNQVNVSDNKSGGEQQLFALMRALESGADILLLDEPTNNLDVNAKRLFFNRLNMYPFGVVIVSHDRELLRQMDKIIELRNGHLYIYGGNYDFYVCQKQHEQDILDSKYANTQRTISRLNNTINVAQNTRQHHESKQRKEINNARRSRLEAKLSKALAFAISFQFSTNNNFSSIDNLFKHNHAAGITKSSAPILLNFTNCSGNLISKQVKSPTLPKSVSTTHNLSPAVVYEPSFPPK